MCSSDLFFPFRRKNGTSAEYGSGFFEYPFPRQYPVLHHRNGTGKFFAGQKRRKALGGICVEIFQKKRHFSEIAGGLKTAPANQIAVLFQIEPLFCKTEAFFMNKILSASNIF